MKIGPGIIAVVTIMSFFFTAHADEKMSYLKHLKYLNGIICRHFAKCNKIPDNEEQKCVEKLNNMSSANPANEKIKILESQSKQCIEELKGTSCKADITVKSTQGSCKLK